MYFLNIEKLKLDLISDKVSQKDIFLYISIVAVLTAAMIELVCFFPEEQYNLWDYVNSVMLTLIPGLGIFWMYKSNGGNNGVKFAERYFAITWVMVNRFVFLLVPVFFAIGILDSENTDTKWWHVLVLNLWYLGYYWRSAKHTKDVANAAPHV